MTSNYECLCKKLALLEIATLLKYKESRPSEGKYVNSVGYKDAYRDTLQDKVPYSDIDWDEEPYRNFKLLAEKPPKRLKIKDGHPKFVPISKVTCWSAFIDSFRQLRNNLVHGAKFLKETYPELEDRDEELINAGLAFISFLEDKGLINLQ
ncbi:MAG: hypothetical protein EA357_06660 [Micavibrio sp.]|nr:MAG: hypothetical protein EA357_06660 [Micavibrio sp.]